MEIDFFSSTLQRKSSRRKQILDENEIYFSQDYLVFGKDYFDNPDIGVGYGGYRYDARYYKAVKKIIKYYALKPGMKILEIGCAKGYILVEFAKQGYEVTGLDISHHAVENCHILLKNKLIVHDLHKKLPLKNNTYDFVFGKEVLAHLKEDKISQVISECMRVGKGKIFFEIQSAKTDNEFNYMRKWDATYQTLKPRNWWLNLFDDIGYIGDCHFKYLFS